MLGSGLGLARRGAAADGAGAAAGTARGGGGQRRRADRRAGDADPPVVARRISISVRPVSRRTSASSRTTSASMVGAFLRCGHGHRGWSFMRFGPDQLGQPPRGPARSRSRRGRRSRRSPRWTRRTGGGIPRGGRCCDRCTSITGRSTAGSASRRAIEVWV